MEFPICTFGFALVVYLTVQVSEARDIPSTGILNEMPKNCTGSDFCLVKHENYPQKQIDELLSVKYRLTLGNPHEDADDRSGTQNDFELCEKDVTYGLIYEIVDMNDNVRVVVQSENLFKQQLRIERCLSTHPQINTNVISTEVENNDFKCAEKTLDYSFLVLTRDGNGVESVKSKNGIPVCCSCVLGDSY